MMMHIGHCFREALKKLLFVNLACKGLDLPPELSSKLAFIIGPVFYVIGEKL